MGERIFSLPFRFLGQVLFGHRCILVIYVYSSTSITAHITAQLGNICCLCNIHTRLGRACPTSHAPAASQQQVAMQTARVFQATERCVRVSKHLVCLWWRSLSAKRMHSTRGCVAALNLYNTAYTEACHSMDAAALPA